MRRVEIILSVLVVGAIVMRLALIPGASLILLMASTFLVFLYFFLGFILFVDRRLRDLPKASTFKTVGGLKILFGVITGVTISTLVLAVLFRINFYPGAKLVLMVGLLLTVPVLFTLVVAKLRGAKDITTALTRTAFWGAFGIFLYLWPYQKHLEFQYRNHSEYVETAIEAMNNPDNAELQEKMEAERRRIK